MRLSIVRVISAIVALVGALAIVIPAAHATGAGGHAFTKHASSSIQLGPRPFYLVEQLREGELKDDLSACAAQIRNYKRTDFSIGHRGAALQFPEHTRESYVAAARMGAGILECDVTFTKDAELVCRHAQCDLHTTTNILATPLAQKCEQGFTPAEFDANGNLVKAATAKCCTSALTRDEFLSLEGKMDAADPQATTVEQYLGGTADFRTDLYATGATVLTHVQSIELFKKLGTGFTPELKSVDSAVGFGDSGLNQQTYARKMIMDYVNAGVDPRRVWAQSFDINDVLLWVGEFPAYGEQAVFLDGRNPVTVAANPPPLSEFEQLKSAGVNIIAPPMPMLLESSGTDIVASVYAKRARTAGLDIISWTTERSGRITANGIEGGTFYYSSTLAALESDGDILRTIDVLAQDVGIIGLFSDWPATTTFYANCLDVNEGGKHGKHRKHRKHYKKK